MAKTSKKLAAAKVVLSGAIGWDVRARDIRESLKSAGDSDIDLEISSPGGLVSEAFEIFNLIKNHPGKVNATLSGPVMSSATYIAMAADTVRVEDNAVFMVHNAWMLTAGDHHYIRKTALILENISAIIAKSYENKTGASPSQVRQWMDDETYFYGSEIVEAGFADSDTKAGAGPEDKAAALSLARVQLQNCLSKMREISDGQNDLNQIAAQLQLQQAGKNMSQSKNEPAPESKTEPVDKSQAPEPESKTEIMPAATAIDGFSEGVRAERQRIAELQSYVDADPQNSALHSLVQAAVAEGKTAQQIQAKLLVAIRDNTRADGDNPPPVGTTGPQNAVLSSEEIKVCADLGITQEAYLKTRAKADQEKN
jgi:ATP-dependent protease ClpP protease subunit